MSDVDYAEQISDLVGEQTFDLTNKKIFVTFQKEGIHKYPNAPDGVEFLQYPHRHMFHFRVEIDVFHNDRDIEFQDKDENVVVDLSITNERLLNHNKELVIMHPGPMNRGVEIDTNLADDINRSLIREQVELGVAVRMACLKIFCKRR